MQRIEPLKYTFMLIGETKNAHVDFARHLCEHRPRMQEVFTVEECDVILAFCPVVFHAETDIEVALMLLDQYAANKPVVLVLLHYTFNPESIVPDSSRCVNRANTFTVDWLFHEDRQLLKCSNNDRAIAKVTSHLGSQMFSALAIPRREFDDKEERQPLFLHNNIRDAEPLKYTFMLIGETKNAHVDFARRLCEHRPRMQEVFTVEECDVILAFCPVVFHAETDIEVALMLLDQYAANKPVVLVLLHYTFDPESIVPDSSRCVNRANTFTVDWLFHEDQQLLKCSNNDRAIAKVTSHLGSQMFSALAIPRREFDDKEERQPLFLHNNIRDAEPLKYTFILIGETKNAHVDFARRLCEHRPRMQEVFTVEECDVILAFCPVVFHAETDIEVALMLLDQYAANKPVVLVLLHYTFNPESIVPDSSRCVNRANTFTVDWLFHEDQQLLKCSNNDRAIAKVTSHLGSQMFSAPAITGREYDDEERQPLFSHNTRRDAEEEYSNTSSCCCRVC
ncbi:uncharacterized protein [Salminus brasiliensis]|uniref:uncharacterized protein isoform X2 n=1 Tax=Salminus brasiliensis TaxID=930266 RepID=UPI003B83856E